MDLSRVTFLAGLESTFEKTGVEIADSFCIISVLAVLLMNCASIANVIVYSFTNRLVVQICFHTLMIWHKCVAIPAQSDQIIK